MNIQTLYVSGGIIERPINVVRLSRTGEAVRPAGYVFSGVIAAQPEHVPTPRQQVDVQAFPAMRLEDYGAKFRRPDRERQKELNQGDPHYSPKSWFTKALADDLGTKEAAALDRLKHRYALGYMTEESYLKAVAGVKAGTAQSLRERQEALETQKWVKQWAKAERNRLLKLWEGNTGPATPQAKPVDAGEAQAWITRQFAVATGAMPLRVESNRSNSVSSIPVQVKHGAVSNGMEARGAYGKGDMHNGNPTSKREEKALELAMFEMRVKAQEKLALELCGKPGGKKAHKSAKNMRRAYNLAEYEFKTAGVMHRLQGFENSAARSSRGKNAAEKIKEGGRQARL